LELDGLGRIVVDNGKAQLVVVVGGEGLINQGSLLFVGEEEDLSDVEFGGEFFGLGDGLDHG